MVDRAHDTYETVVHVYRPEETQQQFEAEYDRELWTKDQELYDGVAKVQPPRNSYPI